MIDLCEHRIIGLQDIELFLRKIKKCHYIFRDHNKWLHYFNEY